MKILPSGAARLLREPLNAAGARGGSLRESSSVCEHNNCVLKCIRYLYALLIIQNSMLSANICLSGKEGPRSTVRLVAPSFFWAAGGGVADDLGDVRFASRAGARIYDPTRGSCRVITSAVDGGWTMPGTILRCLVSPVLSRAFRG